MTIKATRIPCSGVTAATFGGPSEFKLGYRNSRRDGAHSAILPRSERPTSAGLASPQSWQPDSANTPSASNLAAANGGQRRNVTGSRGTQAESLAPNAL